MKKITTALFDFDGVTANTEPQYDVFWNNVNEKYGMGIDDFAHRIKGNTLKYLFTTYFSNFTQQQRDDIEAELDNVELTMNFPPITGIHYMLTVLKQKGYRLGLVTSSLPVKMNRALREMELEGMFETVVTADCVNHGKPAPDCYLLAASNLGVAPEECVVFEDSFPGIKSATDAGMSVIALATTNHEMSLKNVASAVIKDYTDTEHVISLIKQLQ